MKTGSKVMLLGKKFDPAQVGWSASMKNIIMLCMEAKKKAWCAFLRRRGIGRYWRWRKRVGVWK